MRLGGRGNLDMVVRYTRSVKFEDSLRLYRGMENWDCDKAERVVG
jgi:hypothetical protein